MEFKSFGKIERMNKAYITITQKLHGSNAAVLIFEYTSTNGQTHEPRMGIRCQSRTRFITPESDNYGFARFVHDNAQEFIEKLGPGLHFGEWVGPGINSGEGLKEKQFVLFDTHKFPQERPLPPQCSVVPLLYHGPFNQEAIDTAMEDLKTNGSKLVLGFMRPEGIVINLLACGIRWKKVFDAEETSWKNGDGTKERRAAFSDGLDVTHLLQPIRLQKLLSRDELYVVRYPASLPEICSDYIKDLIEEGQISGTDDEVKVIKKALGGQLFAFIKSYILQGFI